MDFLKSISSFSFPMMRLFKLVTIFGVCCKGDATKRRKPFERIRPISQASAPLNYSCFFFEQPLNHFSLPRDKSPTYRQKYCIIDDYVVNATNATILFYTGNESPVEQYINNTGLMWELAEDFNALIVFMEHRYEGESIPSPNITDCMAYSSSVQALADYANFIERHLFRLGTDTVVARPVIAFGGSYGGMLTAWMRMKYPNIITGGIAASAPIWGFPLNFPNKIDAAFQVIKKAMDKPYPPTDDSEEENYCSTNLLASFPLIQYLASEGATGRSMLTEVFHLCSPLQEKDASDLISWVQTPWFDLAEGSFPYPSSYIPFALTHNENAKLPAWPLQSACWVQSRLAKDLGVTFSGDVSDVKYNVTYGESGLVLGIDWDKISVIGAPETPEQMYDAASLLEEVRDAVAIWYNITNDLLCYDLVPAPNMGHNDAVDNVYGLRSMTALSAVSRHLASDAERACHEQMSKGSWEALCCNEEMNLIITDAGGLGRDFQWPPSHPRGTTSYSDVLNNRGDDLAETVCSDPHGYFGFPEEPPDSWSTTYDIIYGGLRIQSHSNIIFSNGLLDPWSAAGVYVADPTTDADHILDVIVPGLSLQKINDRDLVALIMDYGGHHTDLMFSSPLDPPSISKAREIEKEYISKWVEQFWSKS
jgi:lysosomal Pro-X carboxypeptidase